MWAGTYVLRGKQIRQHWEMTHSAKYHAPITPAHVTREIPLATAQDHNQTARVAAIAQLAQPRTCHSHALGSVGGWEK